MSKRIQAYFRNEDDAESARITLAKYDTANLEVGKTPDESYPSAHSAFPFISFGTTGSVANGAFIGGHAPRTSAENGRDDSESPNVNEADSQYVLSVEIQNADQAEIVQILRQHGGNVEVFE